MKRFFFLFFSCFILMNCKAQVKVKTVTTKELKGLLEKAKIQLIDVRTPKEVKKGFIKNAQFVNFYNDDFTEKIIQKLDKNKPVYLYCKVGVRSKKACKILQEKGYEVYNVLGGFNQWKKENK